MRPARPTINAVISRALDCCENRDNLVIANATPAIMYKNGIVI